MVGGQGGAQGGGGACGGAIRACVRCKEEDGRGGHRGAVSRAVDDVEGHSMRHEALYRAGQWMSLGGYIHASADSFLSLGGGAMPVAAPQMLAYAREECGGCLA